jgi:hypothetical protein
MIVAMKQEKNLKDGIIAAVVEQLSIFKDEIIKSVDERFQARDIRLDSLDKKFDEQTILIETRFRHQGVILEDIQDNVKALAEGQVILFSKVDNLEECVTVLEQNRA